MNRELVGRILIAAVTIIASITFASSLVTAFRNSSVEVLDNLRISAVMFLICIITSILVSLYRSK